MKIEKRTEINGDLTIHTLSRCVQDIDKIELKEFGKCMFCSLEHRCKNNCTKTRIFEESERYDKNGKYITED